jgi:hypothetical protein
MATHRESRAELKRGDPSEWGSRPVELISVSLLDGNGQSSLRFDTGGPMTLDMQLLVHRDVGDFVCGMAIRRADGLLLAGTNTFLDHVTLSSRAPGRMVSVRYAIDSLPLLAGGYIVQVSAHDVTGSQIYDHADPAANFHINAMGGHVGMLEMHGRWQVAQDEDVPSSTAARQSAG